MLYQKHVVCLLFNLTALAASNQELYALLTGSMSPEDTQRVQKALMYAEQRKVANGECVCGRVCVFVCVCVRGCLRACV